MVARKWDYSITRMPLPLMFTSLFASFAGEAAITTSYIEKIRAFKACDPNEYARVITDINESTQAAIAALRKINEGEEIEKNLAAFGQAFELGRRHTKQLGVLCGADIESDQSTDLIEDSKKHGAFVSKLPGAGGRDSIGALCTDAKARQNLRSFWKTRSELELLQIETTNNGYIVGKKGD